MITKKNRLIALNDQVTQIIYKIKEVENSYRDDIEKVHPIYRKSALNLIHYLGFRSFDIDELQEDLRNYGLPSLSNIEAHVMRSLLTLSSILNHLLENPMPEKRKGIVRKTKKRRNL